MECFFFFFAWALCCFQRLFTQSLVSSELVGHTRHKSFMKTTKKKKTVVEKDLAEGTRAEHSKTPPPPQKKKRAEREG